jgi:hypothetical protein
MRVMVETIKNWFGTAEALSWMTGLATLVTGLATIALWRATKQLVTATNEMAARSAQASIVATLEPNQWSMRHFDLKVTNTGNATAYGIMIAFDPPLQNGDARAGFDIPLQSVSVLRPSQTIGSYLTGFANLKGQKFQVKTTWKRTPTSSEVETLSYDFDMGNYEHMSGLGTGDPQVQIADQLKHIREDWRSVAKGNSKIQSDVFTEQDRKAKRKADQAYMKKMRAQRAGTPNP